METQNITELQTPIGLITITDGSKKIPFKIRSNAFNIPYEVYDSDNKNTGKQLRTDANYTLSIATLRSDAFIRLFFLREICDMWHPMSKPRHWP